MQLELNLSLQKQTEIYNKISLFNIAQKIVTCDMFARNWKSDSRVSLKFLNINFCFPLFLIEEGIAFQSNKASPTKQSSTPWSP